MTNSNRRAGRPNLQRAPRVSVAGFTPRPLAIPVVEQRLSAASNNKKRGWLAHHLAETCYECFSVENLFRELLHCDPADNDRIQTALVDLDIQLDHIEWHIRELKKPLKAIIRVL